MKNIVIFGRFFKEEYTPQIQDIFTQLSNKGCRILLFQPFYNYLKNRVNLPKNIETFTDESELTSKHDLLISIGGDGTILESATLVKDKDIPILGINTGRLGFLSTTVVSEFKEVLDDIFNKNYSVDKRSTIELHTEENLFENTNFALNELVVHKKDTSSMIGIHVLIDGELLNTYWADGLIVSTPTGSTAYSLSCGGPMLFPKAQNFVITPVAPHNLNSRPIVIPDDREVILKVEGRSKNFLVSLDSRMETMSANTTLTVRKGKFSIPLLKTKDQSFIGTIRQKLHWGLDHRN
ncbi:MAG: NAD+ kinase [Salibacteraceae bacterium]|jgi:NAD+ kinase|tara:strand:+ start:442 stop:1323 length:882 start_codon:yes stop_codon:yes gene_type:complete